MFHSSSQKREWLFHSRDELHALRAEANDAAVAHYKTELQGEHMPDYLTAHEELAIVRHHCAQIPAICARFPFPRAVVATATAYLLRSVLSPETAALAGGLLGTLAQAHQL
eukprot:m.18394 g.18394  ORF g.18394 m.18394 type:complete len:111 (+) comp3669_c0_seq1:34-366(+)